jgi:hypothetical protein
MTKDEIYEFDLRGYIIFRNILSVENVERIRAILANVRGAKDNGKFAFMELDPCFMELMAHPRVLDALKVIVGDWLRFDHAFGIEMSKTVRIEENLHAGPLQNQRSFWYQWAPGQGMHNGKVSVLYALNDVNSGDGGFICIPGSHKGNLYYRPRHDSHLVENPALKSGDALIFTEALVHGSRQWKADHQRRVLFYCFSPGFMAWKHYDTVNPYLSLVTTEIQRELLRPPYVSDYDEHESKRTGEWPKERRKQLEKSNLPPGTGGFGR